MSKRTFAARTFRSRTFASRTWAGVSTSIVSGPGFCEIGQVYVAGIEAVTVFVAGATIGRVFVAGIEAVEVDP